MELDEVFNLLNEEFKLSDLTPEEQKILYNEFKTSYEKSIGSSWEEQKFISRGSSWLFFGDKPNESKTVGGIAVRKQLSNDMYKLNACFGNFRSIVKGFKELNEKHGSSPIWGLVTPSIQNMLIRSGFKTLPGKVIKIMGPLFKKLSGNSVTSVDSNGNMSVTTPDGKTITKVFVCNEAYINWLLEAVDNKDNLDKIPKEAQMLLKPLKKLILNSLNKKESYFNY